MAPIRSGPSTSLFHSRPMVALLITALVFVLIVATVLGNLMVCVAIALVRKLKAQPANLLLVSLAVADFCVGLFVMPMAAVYLLEDKWPFGSLLCCFWVTADLTLCTASILNLCMISVDRLLAVTRALRYLAIRTRRRICAVIGAVWVGSLVVSAVPLALVPFRGNGNVCQVSQNRFYQIIATSIAFWVPALIMVIVYVKLWNAAKKMQRQDRMVLRWLGVQCQRQQNTEPTTPKANGTIREMATNNSSPSLLANANARLMTALRPSPTAQQIQRHSIEHDKNSNNNNNNNVTAELDKPRPSACSMLAGAIRIPLLGSYSSTASSVVGKSQHIHYEDKARKTLGVMMSVFICCWMPFFILALLKSQRIVYHVPTWLDSLALWLGYSNSMLNPLIYCKYNREFRIPFREMICCRFATLQDAMRNESYYAKFGSPRSRNGRRLNSTASRNWPPTERSDGQKRDGGGGGNGKGRHSLAVGPVTADKRNSTPGALAN
uniref:G_PROTEIN_RECEP_F1_2 domain-containing protein n=1 Tax=Globodera pallida TaxID=36090 RepID=A0A183BS20_GLOPA